VGVQDGSASAISVGRIVELRVEVRPDWDAVDLEEAIAAEGRRAARKLYREAVRVLDQSATDSPGVTLQRLEARWVATLFGRVRISRHRVSGPDRTYTPIDRIFGLGRSEYSLALQALVRQVSQRLPYRGAAQLLSQIVGEQISYQSVWRVLHASPHSSANDSFSPNDQAGRRREAEATCAHELRKSERLMAGLPIDSLHPSVLS
jgi:hypothetical protein